jgi:hypothetical protein
MGSVISIQKPGPAVRNVQNIHVARDGAQSAEPKCPGCEANRWNAVMKLEPIRLRSTIPPLGCRMCGRARLGPAFRQRPVFAVPAPPTDFAPWRACRLAAAPCWGRLRGRGDFALDKRHRNGRGGGMAETRETPRVRRRPHPRLPQARSTQEPGQGPLRKPCLAARVLACHCAALQHRQQIIKTKGGRSHLARPAPPACNSF